MVTWTLATLITNAKILIRIWDATWELMWLDENGVNSDWIDTDFDPSFIGNTWR
jgi:hypothetical protein